MLIDEKYMQKCLNLSKRGFGRVAPNPMVGCVIVHQHIIIGEGYHKQYGKNHAEVNAINNVKDKNLLKESTLYVNLEPCAHFGKTPPCSDLIIKYKIPKVVIGCIDSFSEVSGKGVQKMKEKGIEVIVGVLEKEAIELNKRFFTFHNKKRPYIILKWAETSDGFIDVDRGNSYNPEPVEGKGMKQKGSIDLSALRQTQGDKSYNNVDNWITTPESKKLVHQWRSEEQAIMVGTNTALNDNPQLTVREVKGENPIRIVLDLNLRLPGDLYLFDKTILTIVFNYQKNNKEINLELIKINPNEEELLSQILEQLYSREIQSVIIEGGTQLLNTFIEQNLWDEARVFIGEKTFRNGLSAPQINKNPKLTTQIKTDILNTYFND